MSQSQSKPVHLSHVVPNIFVRDVDAALEFYVGKLGFELFYRHEDDPDCDLAIVEMGNVVIHITTCGCEDRRHVGQSYFTIQLDDAPTLYERFQAFQVPMRWELEQQPWGQTDFTIIDPEQNWITFSSDTEEPEC